MGAWGLISMDYKLVYEVTQDIDFAWFFPFIMFIFLLFFPKIYVYCNIINNKEQYNTEFSIRIIKIFSRICAVFVFMFCLLYVNNFIQEYKTIVIPYKEGNYKIVEGYVENYVPMPYEGRGHHESFEINHVKFDYEHYSVGLGYHRAGSHGGIINRNGQKLKIGYITCGNENIIVRIEVPANEEN